MKRTLYFLIVALIGVVLTGCGFFGNGGDVTYTASDLKGTWVEETNPKCYWVYMLDKDESGDYYWGKTWDEADDVFEEDLDFHGNGWFKWKLASGNSLTQVHMLTISEAGVPKTYTVASCSSTTLVLKDSYGKKLTYTKAK
ncbi:MAG: hypothetical protein IKN59_00900 [Paludibacteraceae bacterium]|jgi:hypothetical protein|nr:hypothetical protein [Paludibacteraceae bacterium]